MSCTLDYDSDTRHPVARIALLPSNYQVLENATVLPAKHSLLANIHGWTRRRKLYVIHNVLDPGDGFVSDSEANSVKAQLEMAFF